MAVYRGPRSFSSFRIAVLFIIFIIFIALSFWVYDSLTGIGFSEWYINIVPIAFLWLIYLVIAQFIGIYS